jgi:hypothetical protein
MSLAMFVTPFRFLLFCFPQFPQVDVVAAVGRALRLLSPYLIFSDLLSTSLYCGNRLATIWQPFDNQTKWQ